MRENIGMQGQRYHVAITTGPLPDEACDRCGGAAVLRVRGWDRPLAQLHRALHVQTHALCRAHRDLQQVLAERLAAHGPDRGPRPGRGEWGAAPLARLKPEDRPGADGARIPERALTPARVAT